MDDTKKYKVDTEKEKVQNWEAPQWHRDFGDPDKELSLLKAFCLSLLELDSFYSFQMEYLEEGYIAVNIHKRGRYIGQCQVIDQEIGRMGFFSKDGDEVYTFDKNGVQKNIKFLMAFFMSRYCLTLSDRSFENPKK